MNERYIYDNEDLRLAQIQEKMVKELIDDIRCSGWARNWQTRLFGRLLDAAKLFRESPDKDHADMFLCTLAAIVGLQDGSLLEWLGYFGLERFDGFHDLSTAIETVMALEEDENVQH